MMREPILTPGSFALVLPVLRLNDVSAMNNSLVVGPPAPTALCGFMHAMGLALPQTVKLNAIAQMIHEYELHDGHAKHPVEEVGAVRAGKGGAAIIDEPKASMAVTLIIQANGPIDDVRQSAEILKQKLFRMRLSGGTIVDAGLKGNGAPPETVVFASSDEDLRRLLMRLPDGSVLRGRMDLLDGKEDALEAVLDAISFQSRSPDASSEQAPQKSGWLVPVAIGFRAISSIQARPGARTVEGSVGQVWAEDVTSLGEWIGRRRALRQSFRGCFWRYQCDQEKGLYIVSPD